MQSPSWKDDTCIPFEIEYATDAKHELTDGSLVDALTSDLHACFLGTLKTQFLFLLRATITCIWRY
jgi:hypothetical protein